MPNRKEILHELDHQVADADWCDNDWKDNVPIWVLRGALALLREQEEPVMPELRMTRHGFRQWVVCGNCHEKIDGGDSYCRHCGKAVKWNET